MHWITFSIALTIAPDAGIKAGFTAAHILQDQTLICYNDSLLDVVVKRFTLQINTIIIKLSKCLQQMWNAKNKI